MIVKHSFPLILALWILHPTATVAQTQNVYGNLHWITDDIRQFSVQNFGGPSLRGSQFFLPSFTSSNPADTNAYSQIVYDLGGNANQRLQANLDRPLSKQSRFSFLLDRHSYPGWMTSSFVRSTELFAGYSYHSKSGVKLSALAGILADDREMNGGLVGTNYGFQNDGFSDLTNDVWFGNSYVRDQDVVVNLDASYRLTKSDSSDLSIGVSPSFQRQRFVFENGSVDSLYYDAFDRVVSASFLADSSQLTQSRNDIYANYSLRLDSVRMMSLKAWYGIDFAEYRSNALRTDFVNNRLGSRLMLSSQSMTTSVEVETYLQGFNAGNLNASASSSLRWDQSDSTVNRGGSLDLEASFHRNRAPLLYERYHSEIYDASFNWRPVLRTEAKASLKYYHQKLHVRVGVRIAQLSNWVYFNQAFQVRQDSSAGVLLLSPFVSLDHDGRILVFHFYGAYQYHDRSKLYSLPDWTADGYLGLKFPLFNKRIFMSGGVSAWFYSGYLARGYLPMVDAFYVQQTSRFEDYVQLNPTVSAQIQTVNISLSFVHANYGFTSNSPLVAPGYPSIPRYISLQIDWKFKN